MQESGVSIVAAGRQLKLFGAHPAYLNDLADRDTDNTPLAKITADLPRDATCLDVGANIGATAIPLAVRRPDLRIVAFEPVPSNAEFLRRNIQQNGIANIEVVEAAASDAPGEVMIVDNGPWSLVAEDGGVVIRTLRLDDAVSGPVAFIKIDVEGYEPNALAGAPRILDSRPLIFAEFNSWALLRQHYDPLDFAEAIYTNFDIQRVFHADREVPVPDDPIAFAHTNILAHGCVTDILIRPRTKLPGLREMTGLSPNNSRGVPASFADRRAGAELAAILNSRSWKITAPLRWAGRQMRLMRRLR